VVVQAWFAQLGAAVAYMHSQRVLHRDISSANIFLSYAGEVRLGDLGLSRRLAAERGAIAVGTQCGTPPYMSPELVKGEGYGTSSDVWAVGVVLFELLALCTPFEGRDIVQVI
jgi:serine/threonine protein kinase